MSIQQTTVRSVLAAVLLIIGQATPVMSDVPFAIHGPGVQARHYRMTTFATGLNYPVGMAELEDGSLLVAVSNGSGFFGSTQGSIVRLVDSDADGLADQQSTLIDSIPGGGLTALRVIDDLLFTTGQGRGKPISIYRLGASLAEPPTMVGRIDLRYPSSGGWLHPHSALIVRRTPGQADSYDLFFQVGSQTNFDETTTTVRLTSDLGLEADLAGDAVHLVSIRDDGTRLVATEATQVATGLRNPAGFAFHPTTGDLYLQDNGIDGLQDPNEPTSADELNWLRIDEIGGPIEDFGFPDSYIEYRTGNVIGGQGRAPLVAFLPIPDPQTGAEAEGPNDIMFAPPTFPLPLRDGLFVGMHGRFSLAGLANEENPVVFVDLRDRSYFHFIRNDEPAVGHLDGLLSTNDALYLADISPRGGFGGGTANTGAIYRIESLIPDIDELTSAVRTGSQDPRFDLNGDGSIDAADRSTWVVDINQTFFGDANLDGQFNTTDFVAVFQVGEYEDVVPGNSTWREGDWNGDGDFSSTDFVVALQGGGFEQGRRTAVRTVPEPTGPWWLTPLGLVLGIQAAGTRRERSRVVERHP